MKNKYLRAFLIGTKYGLKIRHEVACLVIDGLLEGTPFNTFVEKVLDVYAKNMEELDTVTFQDAFLQGHLSWEQRMVNTDAWLQALQAIKETN